MNAKGAAGVWPVNGRCSRFAPAYPHFLWITLWITLFKSRQTRASTGLAGDAQKLINPPEKGGTRRSRSGENLIVECLHGW